MVEHEKILSKYLQRDPVKKIHFYDFDGAIKSLGAWGGDFVMAVSSLPSQDVKKYFNSKGYDFCLGYKEIIAENSLLTKEISERTYH